MNMVRNGRGNRVAVKEVTSYGYFLAVFHAIGAPAGHQTAAVGSVAQTFDRVDRARTEIPRGFARSSPGNDEPPGFSHVSLHRHQRQRGSSACNSPNRSRDSAGHD